MSTAAIMILGIFTEIFMCSEVGIMVGMIVAVCILSALFLTLAAAVFCELPRDWRDTFCFLVMLAVSVAMVLVFVMKGF